MRANRSDFDSSPFCYRQQSLENRSSNIVFNKYIQLMHPFSTHLATGKFC